MFGFSSFVKIVDIHDDSLNNLALQDDQGFQISGYRMQFEGICKECRCKEIESSVSPNDSVTFCGKANKKK